MAGPEDELGASCPLGSKFYVCDQTASRFIGCCTLNPCNNDGVCASENLRPASFNKSKYDKIMPQACAAPNVQKWYACSDLTPPFMGCCRENPCILAGCPTDSLGTAVLSSDKENAQVFLGGAYKTATPTEKAAPITSASLTASSTAGSALGSSGLSKGTVGGIAAGVSIGGLLLLATMIFFFIRRRRKNWRNERDVAGAEYEPYMGSTQQYQESKLASSPYSPDFSPYNYQAATFDESPAQAHAQSPSPPNMFPTPRQGNGPKPQQSYKPSETASYTSPAAQLPRDSLFVGELPA